MDFFMGRTLKGKVKSGKSTTDKLKTVATQKVVRVTAAVLMAVINLNYDGLTVLKNVAMSISNTCIVYEKLPDALTLD